MTTQYKSIVFAYPTSVMANHFGATRTGCYYIQESLNNIEGSGECRTGIHPQADSEAFLKADDPALIELFEQVDGDIDPAFLRYGNELALNALMRHGNEKVLKYFGKL